MALFLLRPNSNPLIFNFKFQSGKAELRKPQAPCFTKCRNNLALELEALTSQLLDARNEGRPRMSVCLVAGIPVALAHVRLNHLDLERSESVEEALPSDPSLFFFAFILFF